MLMTVAKFEARSELRPQLLELARALAEHSRADSGCLEYGCYEDITAGNRLLLVGRWTSQEALERHYESAYFRTIISRFADLVVEDLPSASLYEVVEIDRL